jgi:hypothetical protein
MRNLLCSAAVLAISLLTACGSGSGTTVPANIRIVNDTAAGLTLNLNSAAIVSTGARSISGYVSVSPSTYTLSVASAGGQPGPSSNWGLGTAQNYSALAFERGNSSNLYLYTDNQSVSSTGFASLNVVNVSQDAGALDVYLVPHGTTSVTAYQPLFSQVLGASTATTVPTTVNWDIVVTLAGTPTDIRLTVPSPAFVSGDSYTLGLTPTIGGGLVDAILVAQGLTTAAFTPTAQARVRVWSALPESLADPVIVTVGSTALGVSNAPNPTTYQTVAAGSAVTQITVAGTPIVTLPTGTFAAGGDYTILVYGTGSQSGAPAALILSDSNLVSSEASVRFINAAVSASTVTLYINGLEPIFNSSYPNATDTSTAFLYAGVKASSAATVQLIGTGYSGGQETHSFTSGSVFTVLLFDPAQPPLVITDR